MFALSLAHAFARSLAPLPCVTLSLSLCVPSSSTLCMTISLKDPASISHSSPIAKTNPQYISAVFRSFARGRPFLVTIPRPARRLKKKKQIGTTSVNLSSIVKQRTRIVFDVPHERTEPFYSHLLWHIYIYIYIC